MGRVSGPLTRDVRLNKMKTILTALLLLVTAPAIWAAPDAWIVSNRIANVAKQLQSRIPAVSFDGLFEAKRENDGWAYTYYNDYDKTWIETICIRLSRIGVEDTRIEVTAYRSESGMVFRRKTEKPELAQKACKWLKEIR